MEFINKTVAFFGQTISNIGYLKLAKFNFTTDAWRKSSQMLLIN